MCTNAVEEAMLESYCSHRQLKNESFGCSHKTNSEDRYVVCVYVCACKTRVSEYAICVFVKT